MVALLGCRLPLVLFPAYGGPDHNHQFCPARREGRLVKLLNNSGISLCRGCECLLYLCCWNRLFRRDQRASIGYLNHNDAAIRLYLQETFTFLLLTTEAAVALVPPVKAKNT